MFGNATQKKNCISFYFIFQLWIMYLSKYVNKCEFILKSYVFLYIFNSSSNGLRETPGIPYPPIAFKNMYHI